MSVRKKYVVWVLVVGVATILVLLTIAATSLREGALRPRFIASLSNALNCDVTLDRFSVQIVPVIRVTGDGLTIRLRGRSDLPPFIAVTRFTAHLGLLAVLRRHADTVELEGLQLNVPRRLTIESNLAPDLPVTAGLPRKSPFSIGELVAHEAMLNFVGEAVGSRPLNFGVHDLHVKDAAFDQEMRFTSSVTNPLPRGLVETAGTFGPWRRDDPTQTPLAGTYSLSKADLGTINGISGTVSSAGAFRGALTEIHVVGTSSTPDLSLDLGGKPEPLTTEFTATVDGTDGTTRLDRVTATLGRTSMLLSGAITNLEGPGHDVRLVVEVRGGRAEDLLKLAIASERPPMTGAVALNATLKLPSGPGSARQRMRISGSFDLNNAQFNDPRVQNKLKELSRRGQGKAPGDMDDHIVTDMKGTFSLGKGVLALPHLEVAVPGALIALEGHYIIGSEELAFTGSAALKASLSKVVGGFRSILIAPFNRLFSKGGTGSVLPIEITGTRAQPKFNVRMGQVFRKGK